MLRDALIEHLNHLLHPELFKDYAPNGLQVQGKSEVQCIVCAVSATQRVIDRACELQADALLVHHGWFWRGENAAVVGTKYKRLKALLSADINLIAYHLPLDAHETLGNNARLGALLGATEITQLTDEPFVWTGTVAAESLEALADRVGQLLGREPLVLGQREEPIRKLAWCSGAAQDFFEIAVAAGVDAYLSGEAAERTTHFARESGVPYLVCGHHATERLGICALGEYIEKELGLECIFVDDDNPI